AQLVNLDGRLGGVVTDKVHDVARFGESLSRREPSAGCRHCARRHAAQTESASRHDVLIEAGHGFLLWMSANSSGRAAAEMRRRTCCLRCENRKWWRAIVAFCPLTQPASFNPWRNAAASSAYA